ncbi:hypothetical protein Hokovirus_1_269 [Hokovirus HKV1]|uniref:Uncharacterized protein n=1 Tax=Hokovirus HKV1 TaxID=1977638 RepID=A0A1V0SF97_9VIRU|nr:hypothetical protein Hokovirus_1_269 [Hokovirus HKV1]
MPNKRKFTTFINDNNDNNNNNNNDDNKNKTCIIDSHPYIDCAKSPYGQIVYAYLWFLTMITRYDVHTYIITNNIVYIELYGRNFIFIDKKIHKIKKELRFIEETFDVDISKRYYLKSEDMKKIFSIKNINDLKKNSKHVFINKDKWIQNHFTPYRRFTIIELDQKIDTSNAIEFENVVCNNSLDSNITYQYSQNFLDKIKILSLECLKNLITSCVNAKHLFLCNPVLTSFYAQKQVIYRYDNLVDLFTEMYLRKYNQLEILNFFENTMIFNETLANYQLRTYYKYMNKECFIFNMAEKKDTCMSILLAYPHKILNSFHDNIKLLFHGHVTNYISEKNMTDLFKMFNANKEFRNVPQMYYNILYFEKNNINIKMFKYIYLTWISQKVIKYNNVNDGKFPPEFKNFKYKQLEPIDSSNKLTDVFNTSEIDIFMSSLLIYISNIHIIKTDDLLTGYHHYRHLVDYKEMNNNKEPFIKKLYIHNLEIFIMAYRYFKKNNWEPKARLINIFVKAFIPIYVNIIMIMMNGGTMLSDWENIYEFALEMFNKTPYGLVNLLCGNIPIQLVQFINFFNSMLRVNHGYGKKKIRYNLYNFALSLLKHANYDCNRVNDVDTLINFEYINYLKNPKDFDRRKLVVQIFTKRYIQNATLWKKKFCVLIMSKNCV